MLAVSTGFTAVQRFSSYFYAEGLVSLTHLLPHPWDIPLPVSQQPEQNEKLEVQPEIPEAILLCSPLASSFLST